MSNIPDFSLLLLLLRKQIPEVCPAPVPVGLVVPDSLALLLLRPYRCVCQPGAYLLPARNEKILELLFPVLRHFHFLLMLISFFCVSFCNNILTSLSESFPSVLLLLAK